MAEAVTTAADTKDTTAAATSAATTTAAATTGKDTTTAAASTTQAAATTTAATTDATTQKGYWPDDWLTRVSKGDEKVAKQLGRYASPEALAEAHVSLRRRMDSGEFKPALPKDAKPEELKAWRKDNGIPEKPDGYDIKGIDVPEADRDLVNGFLGRMHAKHAPPEVAREALKAYYEIEQRNNQARAAKDEEQRISALDTLNGEWGGQFRRNVNLVEGMLAKFPQSVRDLIKSARLPDGTALFNSPDALRGFVSLALEVNPAGIVAPNSGGDLGKTMVERYTDIQKVMREDRGRYNKDAGMQKEYRELIDALIKHDLMDKNGVLKERKAA